MAFLLVSMSALIWVTLDVSSVINNSIDRRALARVVALTMLAASALSQSFSMMRLLIALTSLKRSKVTAMMVSISTISKPKPKPRRWPIRKLLNCRMN